jgi:hypothetical protein
MDSKSSTSKNVHASGDQYAGSLSNPSERVNRWSIIKRQGDVDRDSSNSLKVNIGDLADAEELKKIAQIVGVHQQQADNLIEDFQILNGFRTHSKDVLSILSRKNIAPHLFDYGERDTGRKLLAIAAESGWYEGALYLLNRGVNINETDHENRTALMDCLTSTDTSIMTALIKKPECNLDIQTLTGHTAAHYAVMMNVSTEIFLIKETPAVVFQKISFFEMLIKSNARLDLCNDSGKNVLHQIVEFKRKECWSIVKHRSHGTVYLKHLINTETHDHKTCLTLAFEHRPNIYFFKELLPYSDKSLTNMELFQSWSKAYKLIEKKNFIMKNKNYDASV